MRWYHTGNVLGIHQDLSGKSPGNVLGMPSSYLGQHLLVLDDVLVGGKQHVELAAAQDGDEGSAGGRGALEERHSVVMETGPR